MADRSAPINVRTLADFKRFLSQPGVAPIVAGDLDHGANQYLSLI